MNHLEFAASESAALGLTAVEKYADEIERRVRMVLGLTVDIDDIGGHSYIRHAVNRFRDGWGAGECVEEILELIAAAKGGAA